MRALLVLLALTATAHADTVRVQSVTIQTLDAGGNAGVTEDSVRTAVRDVRACGKGSLDIPVSFDIRKGRATNITARTDDAKVNKCVQRTLSKMRLAAAKAKVHVDAAISVREIPLAALGKLEVKSGPPGPNDHQANDINTVIKSRASAYRSCYTTALAKQPKLGGKFVYRIEVGEDGKVTRAKPVAPTKQSAALDRCMIGNLAQLVFAAKGKATINYPFIFSAP